MCEKKLSHRWRRILVVHGSWQLVVHDSWHLWFRVQGSGFTVR